MTTIQHAEDAAGIKTLTAALMTQIFRWTVASAYQYIPELLRLHHPVIDRGRYLLRLSPTRFAIQLYRHPSLVRDDEQFLAHYLKPGMTYVDVGANIGTTTLAAARAVGPNGAVIAFEAHPRTFRDLVASVAMNSDLDPRITLIYSAVGSAVGSAAISDLPENDVNHIDTVGIPVPMTTLDDALNATAHIDLLKVDVEGYELEVFEGATQALERTEAIYFESCEANFAQFGYTADDLFELLTANGFSCYAVDPADFSLTPVQKGRRCVQGYENLLARKERSTL